MGLRSNHEIDGGGVGSGYISNGLWEGLTHLLKDKLIMFKLLLNMFKLRLIMFKLLLIMFKYC